MQGRIQELIFTIVFVLIALAGWALYFYSDNWKIVGFGMGSIFSVGGTVMILLPLLRRLKI